MSSGCDHLRRLAIVTANEIDDVFWIALPSGDIFELAYFQGDTEVLHLSAGRFSRRNCAIQRAGLRRAAVRPAEEVGSSTHVMRMASPLAHQQNEEITSADSTSCG
jgi:hypothetical protein